MCRVLASLTFSPPAAHDDSRLDILALGSDTAQFRCWPVPQALTGASYEDLRRSQGQAVVCGIINPQGAGRWPRELTAPFNAVPFGLDGFVI